MDTVFQQLHEHGLLKSENWLLFNDIALFLHCLLTYHDTFRNLAPKEFYEQPLDYNLPTHTNLIRPIEHWSNWIEYNIYSNISFFLPFSCNVRNEKVHSMKSKLFFLSSSKSNSIWVKISDFCAKVENQHICNMSPNILLIRSFVDLDSCQRTGWLKSTIPFKFSSWRVVRMFCWLSSLTYCNVIIFSFYFWIIWESTFV